MRGVLTAEIKEASMRLLRYVISEDELRLMPYIQHIVMNSKRLDESKLNNVELGVFDKWRDKRFLCFSEHEQYVIELDMSFWIAIGEIVWLSYLKPPSMLGNVNYDLV